MKDLLKRVDEMNPVDQPFLDQWEEGKTFIPDPKPLQALWRLARQVAPSDNKASQRAPGGKGEQAKERPSPRV